MIDQRLASLGLELPPYVPPAWAYKSITVHRDVAYISGHIAKTSEGVLHVGKVGDEVSLEQACESARLSILNALATFAHDIGPLDRIEEVLKLVVFVASSPDFHLQPKVADAASKLLADIFGDRCGHARSAVGVAVLPRNSSVEVELVVALRPA